MKKINQNDINEKWYLIDASGKRIGTLASVAAELLMGKNDPLVRSHVNPNAHVVIINAEKIDYTEKRGFSKFYKWYSGFPGGLRFKSLDEMMVKDPTYPIEHAIKGMLPKNTRGNTMITKLRIFVGADHKHEAQQPVVIDLNNYKM